MEKTFVIDSILSICKSIGFPFTTKVKTDKWKADVVVDCATYKIAFNVCNLPRNVEDVYLAMRQERVCGCWMLLPSFRKIVLSKLPCFYIQDIRSEVNVLLHKIREEEHSLPLDDFIHSMVLGNIRYTETMKVKYVEVCFYQKICWKCHEKNHIYLINKLISTEGIEIESGIDSFYPEIVNGVKQYLDVNSDLNIKMGEIKPRYSKFHHGAYMSFGCAYCDSLFGSTYIQDAYDDLVFCVKTLPKARILISRDLVVPANRWYKRDLKY